MIDLKTESILSLSAAARMLPPGRRGRPVSLSCVLRWVIDGVRSPSGDLVRLEATRLGGRWLTSVEALQRFTDRQTPSYATPANEAPVARATPRRAAERAAAELDKIGI